MTLLSEEARILTHPHLRGIQTDDGLTTGTEEALLTTLNGLIAGGGVAYGTSEGGGGGGSRPPISLDALDLWQEITETIDTNWPGAGDPQSFQRVPHALKLNAWVVRTMDPVQEAGLLELVRNWTRRIREILEPSKRMPLSGFCPECEKSHVELPDDEGRVKFDTAIIAYPDANPVYAQCRVCEFKWEGSALHDLGARIS